LDRDFPLLRLKQGDRIEPSAELRDVAAFDQLELPATVLFWRPACETLTHHRNPLLCSELGIGYDSLIVDVLHCMHLGVLQRYVSFCLWSLILANSFKVRATGEDELIALSAGRVRALLFEFYPRYKRLDPDHSTLTELNDFSVKTLGPKGAYVLKTKAAMTRPLVPFTLELLQKFGGSLPHQAALHAGGTALNRILLVMRAHADVMPSSAVQD
jgi:hypothetical protein